MSEQIRILKPRKALNKAFLKVKPNRTEIESFKTNLSQLLDRINDSESEEFHKNLVSDFLKKTYYEPNHFINTKGRNDLVIHNSQKASGTVGVIIEAKNPTNKAEMLKVLAPGDTPDQMISKLNVKALQELVLYYLRERITQKNIEIKYLIATNIYEWFIFDATLFDRLFAQNKNLVKQFNDFESGRLADTKTDFFYRQIAEPFIAEIKHDIEFTHFDIRDYEKPLRNADKKDDNQLIALFKLLSPEHLLKLPFANDSNSLDKRFYGELLHIIGLTETKDGSKKLIGRKKEGERNTGSFLENAIIQLDSLDKISRLENPSQYGANIQERLFNVGLELSITWINRILFLKLLEAQLITYHRFDKLATGKGDRSYEFLSIDKIKDYDGLNSLFFQVLARKHNERNKDIAALFAKVPYLNSSLFEPTEIEHSTLFISQLRNDKTIPIYSQTVLKESTGKKRTGNINPLEYLFDFLNAYDFTSEGSEEIQEDNKTLINASVLGLIFEKINGYKDGSFFTPGFITMYMCRETIRKAVVQKFDQDFPDLRICRIEDIYELIPSKISRKEANAKINSLKICDPAVGSGHFLVSALNEIIAIKNDLKILEDKNGKSLNRYEIEVVNDELVVTDEDGELFEYNPNSKESQRVQETLFHEKQTIIENCLFGVDINPNSVKICRLRLWIELLKNAYYLKTSPPSCSPNSSSPYLGEVSAFGGRRGQEQLNNLPHLKTFRRELRNNLTPAEAKLWTLLKGKQMEGRKFRRQHSVANYILDFYCPEERIAIELDGQGHFEATQAEYDRERDLFLETFGIRVLRFENKWVWDNPEGLLERVRSYFGKQPPRPTDTFACGFGEQPPRPSDTFACGFGEQPPRPSDTPPYKGGELLETDTQLYKGGELLELQTLPNIDINIKCGNSLVSRFTIDADLKQALKKSKWTIDTYRIAVATYRNAGNREQKKEMERLIAGIKSDFRNEISLNDPKVKKLRKLSGDLFQMTNQGQLFEMSQKEKADWSKKVQQLTDEIQKLEAEIEGIKSNRIYENAFEWRFEFPEVLNDDGDFVGFDVVIGNPPYIRQEELREFKAYFKTMFKLHSGTTDIYVYFIEKGFGILKDKGVFTFIMPNKFMQAGYGQPARKFLLENNLLEIIDFGDFQVFDEATTYPCILFAFKGKPGENIFTTKIKSANFTENFAKYIDANSRIIKHSSLSSETWVIEDSKSQILLQKMCSKGLKLENYISDGAKRGVLTGLTEAFLLDDEKRNNIIDSDPISARLIKPFLLGRDVKPYATEDNKNWLILIPKGFTIKRNLPPDNPNYVAEPMPRYGFVEYEKAWEWLMKNYPGVAGHLINYRDKAEARTDKGDYWWELRACDYYDKFMHPKIMYQKFQVRPCFIFEDREMYCNDSMWFIPSDDKVLLGILNSNTGWWLISKYCTAIQNGYQLIWKYFSQIPIATGNDIVRKKISDLVTKILLTKKQSPAAGTTPLEREIDQLVYQLYDLTEEEIAIIENSTK